MAEALEQALFGIGVNSETRLASFLAWTARHGSELGAQPAIFWSSLHRAWNACDDTWHQRDEMLELVREFQGYLDNHPCDHLVEQEDKSFYAALPDRIAIYRGCHMDRIMGLAWTTDREVALTYAKGHRQIEVPDPILASATVAKSAILGAYQDRQESEVLVDPRDLKRLRARLLKTASAQTK